METKEITQTLHETFAVAKEITAAWPWRVWERWNGKEWTDRKYPGGELLEKGELVTCILYGNPIRIKPLELLTPGDGRELNNPDNLSAEVVKIEKRLLLPEEVDGRHYDVAELWGGPFSGWVECINNHADDIFCTYRVPASTPWPEMQLKTPLDGRPLLNPQGLTSSQIGCKWRLPVAEDTLEMRPETEVQRHINGVWVSAYGFPYDTTRTYRVSAEIPWPPHKWAKEMEAHAAQKPVQFRPAESSEPWILHGSNSKVDWNGPWEFRIAPSQVPFDKDDIVPGMAFQRKNVQPETAQIWANPSYVGHEGLWFGNSLPTSHEVVSWSDLLSGYEYSLPWPIEGQPDWKPCSKQP